MKLALLSHNNKIAHQKELSRKIQQSKIQFSDIELVSKEILQRYTNNVRMEAKQQLIEIKCPQINTDSSWKSKQLKRREIKKWLSQVCNSVFSIAYNSYKKSQMSEQQMKIYCSENLLLNIIKLSESNDLAVQDYEFIDKVLKNDILSYYKDKYPPTMQKKSYKRFKAQIQDVDTMEDFENELVKTSKLEVEYDVSNFQYYGFIMQFINFCIQLPDKKCQQEKESSYFDEFRTQMADIFSKVEDIDYMRGKNTQEKIQKSQKELEQEQEYREKVKKYTHFKIGRKVPQYIPKFTEQQITNQNISVKDPTILRFLTKWLQQLEENLENIQSKLASAGYDLNHEKIKEIKAQKQQNFKLAMKKIYEQQKFCDYAYLDKKQIDMIPKSDKLVGVFSCIASKNQSTFIIQLISSIIYHLDQLTIGKLTVPSITCKIGDLIRCKCSSGQKEILKIYQQLKDRSNKNPQNLKIIRTKNRLQRGTKDILINVLFKNTILCQIQLSINQDQSSQSILNSFNHYLYELQRSKFGPINELANVWTKDPRYNHIAKLLEKNYKKNAQKKCECNVEMQQQQSPLPFICSYCDRYYDRNISFILHKKCQNCQSFWKCSDCSLDQIIEKQAQLKELLNDYSQKDDCQLIKTGKSDVKIPKNGMFISKVSKTKSYIEFKSFDLPDQKDIYLVKDINTILYTIPKGNQNEFFNDKIVFNVKKITQLQILDDQKFKKTVLLPKVIKSLYKNQSEILKLGFNKLNNQQLDNATKGEQKCYQNIKSINLIKNNIQQMRPILIRFKNLQFLNLANNAIQQIPDQIESMNRLTKLHLQSNQIQTIPDSLGNLQNLYHLNLSSNNCRTLPDSLGNLKNLKHLYLQSNRIQIIPQSLGNLQSLGYLSLHNNKIETIPDSLGNLKNLYHLNLSSNNCRTLPDSLGNLKNLNYLYLTGNYTRAIPESIGNLQHLSILYMQQNHFEKIPESFMNLKNLTKLIIYNNYIRKIPESIKNLNSLNRLLVNNNQIEAIPQSIAFLQNLTELDLSRNRIQIIPESLGSMKSLRILYLSQNRIQNIPQSLGNLKTLGSLYIENNTIQKIPQSLGNLQNLRYLIISKNKVQMIPESFQNLHSLVEINLSYNNIQNIPKSICKLGKLQALNLIANKITVSKQLIQLLMTFKASIYLNQNKISLSQQDWKWIKLNQLDQRIKLS